MTLFTVLVLVFLGYASTTEAIVPCYMPTSQMTAYYFKEDRSWAIRLGWIEGNPFCDEVQLLEETEGTHVFQESATRHCKPRTYCYFNTSEQFCENGKPMFKSMKFATNCAICGGQASSTFTIGRIRKVNFDDFVCPEIHPNISLNLQTHGCTKFGSEVVITWEIDGEREYTYTVKDSSGVVKKTATVSAQGDPGKGFVVTNKIGTLTIPSTGLGPNKYTIEVVDITSDKKYSEQGVFSIKAGCKVEKDLDIDARGICYEGESNGNISWSVQADRMYKYTISRGSQSVEEGTISGSGNDSFPVVNGRGQLSFELESGDYRVTLQDLHAGVNDYYTESEAFSVPNCGIRIRTSTCIEIGQNMAVYLASVEGHTYRYTVSVEGTSQQVLEGSVETSQGGGIRGFILESTDTLAVGRYILTVTEEETGRRGYGRFLVGASGDISPEVKYRANAEHDGMYVCLDPGEGESFANGLTVKVGSGAKAVLRGKGNCFTQAYTGRASTLTIIVRKNGKMDGEVGIQYNG